MRKIYLFLSLNKEIVEKHDIGEARAGRLDKKDHRLLYLLDLNGREPTSSLAKKMRMSKEGVAYRMRRLEEMGVVQGYITLIDISALGYLSGRYMIRFQRCDPKKENEIIHYFKQMGETWWVDSRGGEYNFGIAVWAKSLHELYDFKDEFLRHYKPYMMRVAFGYYHQMRQYPRTYLLGSGPREDTKPIILWNSPPKEHDETDRAILRLIATHARMPMVELARHLGLTPAVVKYRLKKMEKAGIVLGYRADLQLKHLGYFWYKIEFNIRDFSKREAILKFAAALPNVIYMYDLIGGADIEIEAEVRDANQLLGIINAIRARFSDEIISYDYYLWSYEHKLALVPP